MEQRFGGRYAVRTSVQAMSGGHLFEAEDLSLQRRVLVFVPAGHYREAQTRTQMLRAAGFTHDDFMHVLDVGMSLGNPYAVFKWCNGAPLVQQLRKHQMTPGTVLTSLYNLGRAMQEAAEEGTYGFSVLADNLWLGHGGRLLPIRYWEAAPDNAKGAVGLCNLLFELCVKEETLPDKPETAGHRLRTALHELTNDRAEAIVALVSRTYREKLALTAFLTELSLLLPISPILASTAGVPALAAAVSRTTPKSTAASPLPASDEVISDSDDEYLQEEPEERSAVPGRRVWQRLAVIVGAACLFVAVFIGGLTFVFHLGGRSDAGSELSRQQSSQALAAASRDKTEQAQPPDTASEPPKPTADGGASASGPTTVPKLIGMPKADAEKAALAAGLRYTFYLESNDAPQGSVYKQEPASGGAAVRGESVTFWVSKGK